MYLNKLGKTGWRKRRKYLIVVILLFSVLYLIFPLLCLFGGCYLCIVGDKSMTPTFSPGDIVIGVRDQNLKAGDIVILKKLPGEALVIKRIIKFEDDKVITKGDNEAYPLIIERSSIIAKVIFVQPKLSRVGVLCLGIVAVIGVVLEIRKQKILDKADKRKLQ
jgi:signal peptidase I